MNPKEHIDWTVIRKMAQGTAEAQETQRFEKWLDEDPRHRIFYTRVASHYAKAKHPEWNEDRVAEAWHKFNARPVKLRHSPRKPSLRLAIWKMAAAVVLPLALAAGGWLYWEQYSRSGEQEQIAHIVNDVRLILPDGSEVILDRSTENSRIARQGDVVLSRENGKLIHEKQAGDAPAEIRWGTIEVPKGAQFNLALEDGTQVWLNADSRLRFPLAFPGGERRVILEGEAYFAVSKDKQKPFIVETPRQNLQVLGTEFNVYAYRNGSGEYTTLVEGSVSVAAARSGKSVVLAPGQQAALMPDAENHTVSQVDAGTFTAWRGKVFVLEGNTLGEVFQKLSRWYDFDFTFEDERVAGLVFSGNLRISENVGVIFEAIEALGHVEIVVKGKTVKIKNK